MIRPESEGDIDAVRAVLASAFPTQTEAKLVDDLRAAGDLVLALVADQGGVIGHAAFSRLALDQPDLRATALGPIGVMPARQRQGIGSALVREGLSRLSQTGEDLVLVLGEASFYERFGFNRKATLALHTPYDGPYLLAKALSERGSNAHGTVCYPPAFAALE
jgi:putative acetyltransferase